MESELARNARLMWAFVTRDLRARYAGSALGLFWSIIHPLIMLCLYIAVFSTLVPRGGKLIVKGTVAEYAVFLCPAILAWNWFNESLVGACSAVTGNGSLIRKVVFPAAILPPVNLIAGLLPFAIAMLVFLGFVALVGAFSLKTLLYLPVVVALQFSLLVGPAYLLAALNVFLRDTAQIVVALLQFLFWGSPIVYPEDTLTRPLPWIHWWFDINPVARLMDAYRDVIIGHTAPSLGTVAYLAILSILAYHVGRAVFQRSRRHFPDEV
jgi:ABC-type polysaccharide/polyol phosphate export permease